MAMERLKQQLTKAGQEHLSREEILKILEERTLAAQHELACQRDAGSEVLGYLASHGGVATRRAVAANSAAPPNVNQILCDDEDDDVRAELACKIARLMPDLTCEETLELRLITIAMLEKLARDQQPRVRAILAEEIKNLDCVPKSLVNILARDIEEIVAAPILEYSPLLSDTDLIEIIAGAKADCALTAIARRRPLGSDVADVIVSSLDISAVAALLANPQARIREQTLDRLVETAENIGALHEPLTLRTDLSERTIRRLAGFVGTALLESLTARHKLGDDTRLYLNRRLRARLQDGEDRDSGAAQTALQVAAVAQDGLLNGDFVEAAAEAGNKEAVIAALAALARTPTTTVRRILDSRSAKAVIALVWRARLSMRVAFMIQNFVMKLVATESLPARDGKDFPLSEAEMRWQLDYFGVAESDDETKPASEM